MEMGWILGGVFSVITVVFIALAIVAPEWVGIQGRVAREIEESHRRKEGDEPSQPENKT